MDVSTLSHQLSDSSPPPCAATLTEVIDGTYHAAAAAATRTTTEARGVTSLRARHPCAFTSTSISWGSPDNGGMCLCELMCKCTLPMYLWQSAFVCIYCDIFRKTAEAQTSVCVPCDPARNVKRKRRRVRNAADTIRMTCQSVSL